MRKRALAFILGALAWVLYKSAWGMWRYFSGPDPRPDYPTLEHAPEVLGFAAMAALAEFIICGLVAVLALAAFHRFGRSGVAISGVLGTTSLYLVSAATIAMLPDYLRPDGGITWQSFVPGPTMIAHLGASAILAASMWRFANGGERIRPV